MKSIKLFFKSERNNLVLPFSHTEHLQGLFYALLSAGDGELAQKVHVGDVSSKYKFFSFGDVIGNSQANIDSKLISFIGTVEWEIRSMQDEIIESIQKAIETKSTFELYTNNCVVCGYSLSQKTFLSDEFVFRMNTPITVYSTDENKRTNYFNVNDDPDAFSRAVIENLKNKYLIYFDSSYSGNLEFLPIGKKHQKIVTTYKNTIVNAHLGVYKLVGEPELLEIAYYSGIGSKNPAGFGFVDDR